MNIINKFGLDISDEVIKNITSELFEIVRTSPKSPLPTRINLVQYLLANYREHDLDLWCAGQIEERMESNYCKELKELGYELLNKYDPDYFKKKS